MAGGRSVDKKQQGNEKAWFQKYDLQNRAVLGPTTMDNQLAFLMVCKFESNSFFHEVNYWYCLLFIGYLFVIMLFFLRPLLFNYQSLLRCLPFSLSLSISLSLSLSVSNQKQIDKQQAISSRRRSIITQQSSLAISQQ